MGMFFRIIFFYLVVLLCFTALFIGLMRTGLLSDLPIFYKGDILLVVSAIIIFVIALVLGAARWRSLESLIASIMVAGALNFGFFVIIPVTIDRSVTTFMLSGMDAEFDVEKPFTKPELRSMLVDQFIDGFDGVGRRLDEQMLSGNIATDGQGNYHLTNQGKSFLRFAQTVADVYAIPPRYISNEGRDGS